MRKMLTVRFIKSVLLTVFRTKTIICHLCFSLNESKWDLPLYSTFEQTKVLLSLMSSVVVSF